MEAVSLVGKTAIVTGANTGIGKETARELARRGARVILACRSAERANAARDEIIKSTANEDVIVMLLDLASLSSVKQFAEDFNRTEGRLDLLVNNAAVAPAERALTEDGFELNFGVNHLGHFYLTNLLLDKLKSSAPSRIVVVSSEGYRFNALDFDDLQTSRGWTILNAYCRSKTANILFATHLATILEGSGVTTYSLAPGFVDSELRRDIENACIMRLLVCCYRCFRSRLLTSEEGARTTLYCCLEPSLQHQSGLYYCDSRQKRAKRYATDAQLAERLWTISADLCKLSN